MKRKAVTLLAFLTSLTVLSAQTEYKQSIIGMNAGVSVPFAEFAAHSMDGYSGFARQGINIDLDYLRYTGRYFGISTNIGYASVFFNEKDYQAGYDRILGNYGINEVNAGNYQVLKGLLGIILKVPETRNTEVMLLLNLGVALCVHPDLQVTNSSFGGINSIVKNSDRTPISNAGLKVNYWISDKYGFSLNYSVNLAKPVFNDQTGVGQSFVQPMRYMNVNAGFVMKL